MCKLLIPVFFSITLAMPVAAQTAENFWSYWGDGKAEVSSYEVQVPRYGELRKTYDALIFVTEDFDSITHVKNDVKRDSSQPVLKLNHARRFQTGIYDYAMMLSSFVPITGARSGLEAAPLKTSLAVTEWCGNYFEQWNRKGDSLKREVRSYFEAEGDSTQEFDAEDSLLFEDDLLIRVRELQGRFPAGNYPIVTSSFYGRLQKFTPSLSKATVKRSVLPEMNTPAGVGAVVRYSIAVDKRTIRVDVLDNTARQILGWERSAGDGALLEKGKLLETRRTPYWALQGEAGAKIRAELNLPPVIE